MATIEFVTIEVADTTAADGGVVQAPDGTIWTVASSAKKDSGPVTRQVDEQPVSP
jgi:hypothetical protein